MRGEKIGNIEKGEKVIFNWILLSSYLPILHFFILPSSHPPILPHYAEKKTNPRKAGRTRRPRRF
mgnify:CR=1 FL=1